MSHTLCRVRFAPAPTGLMHLGNVRTALMNYLFARQQHGTFVVRIEDTDQERNFDPGAQEILRDLAWLGITYNEGPVHHGSYGPYFQSQRTEIYQEKLTRLIDHQQVYRCFCTSQELERKRERQIALKQPPRYDRTCLAMSAQTAQALLEANTPFIWRLKLPSKGTVMINDLARGSITFDLQHFSDAPITRQDHSFTFLFANFVDDLTMAITHIFRGEDHLTNTAVQAVLYEYWNAPLPTYWHMPILCNTEGKKLSKRDFGFSLQDLRTSGYLPEAICNYLAIIGGSFSTEIMSMKDLIQVIDFNHISASSSIKYDVEKLTWVNRQWIGLISNTKLVEYCTPYLLEHYPQMANLDIHVVSNLLQVLKQDFSTLRDCVQACHFYFNRPDTTSVAFQTLLSECSARTALAALVKDNMHSINHPETFMTKLKEQAKATHIPVKELYHFLRLALLGQTQGPAITELIALLGTDETRLRLERICAS